MFLMIFKGPLRSIMDYGIPFGIHLQLIEKIQRRATRIVLELKKSVSYEERLKSLNLTRLLYTDI